MRMSHVTKSYDKSKRKRTNRVQKSSNAQTGLHAVGAHPPGRNHT